MDAVTKRVLLVDNGSLEPASTRQLRRIAVELEKRVAAKVEPVSLAHSDKVPAEKLEGRGAELYATGFDRVLREDAGGIVVAPLFVGPSHAITRWMPAMIEERTKGRAEVSVTVAAPLWVPGEMRLGEMLAEEVRAGVIACKPPSPGLWRPRQVPTSEDERPRVAVVDHGSPVREVTVARDAVAAQLRELLGGTVAEVAACSMERRTGAEFDFNEPLLETLLRRDAWRTGPLVVALLFIAPGRHAGPDGDVARIVRAARGGELRGVKFTRVLGEHPGLIDILADRVRAAN